MGPLTPVKTEKSLSQEPLVVITHLINMYSILFYFNMSFISLQVKLWCMCSPMFVCSTCKTN